MATKVKVRPSRISSKHQITLPKRAMESAGLAAGDRVTAIPSGPGRILIERVENPVEKVAGTLTGMLDRKFIESLRDEWDR
ncbi:MAG: AbrB/MazE/SpoVT family DNA-binding domain-containing protein [Chloroflexi bacterium]|nr:AbrB/MazE/SpoVT family DNA-binding domain-containing protein [Chloroflexota bacterium]